MRGRRDASMAEQGKEPPVERFCGGLNRTAFEAAWACVGCDECLSVS